MIEWAAGRPFVWIDDEIGDADRSYVSTHHMGRALLRWVDPRPGLTDADFAHIRGWLGGSGYQAVCRVAERAVAC